MDKITLIRELWLRISSGGNNTPVFFKKLKAYSIYIVLAIALAFGLEWLEIFTIPAKISGVLIAAASYFLGSGSTAALPVDDKAKAGIDKVK